MASFADHFSALAERYAAFRPGYPASLVAALAAPCARTELAWDVGCGSGQLSTALADRFARVIATDPAAAQLAHAGPHPRVEYRCTSAEASGLDDASVDLAVAAQAAHWFDWPRFVAELARVVRPGGVAALVSYGWASLGARGGAADPARAALDAYQAAVGPHWPPGRAHVDNGYRDLVLPWPPLDAPTMAMTARWTVDQLLGYVATWSASARLRALDGGLAQARLHRDLCAAWPAGEPREVAWPLTVKLARR